MGLTLIPGNPNPQKQKRDLLPEDHWLRTRRFVDAEHTYLGRGKDTVQEAILAFCKTGNKFPDLFDHDNPDHYFVQKIERVHINQATRDGIQVTAKEKHQGYAEIPLVWNLGNLWSATNCYTNFEKEHGAGRRYDRNFSFPIKILSPEWSCHTTAVWMRDYFWQEGEGKGGLKVHPYEGLSPWEKHIKKLELKLFREAKGMAIYDVIAQMDRFSFVDHEFDGFLGHLFWYKRSESGWEEIRMMGVDDQSIQRLSDIHRAMAHASERRDRDEKRSDFRYFLGECYSEVAEGIDRKSEEGIKAWKEADDLLQKAFCNEPYDKSGETYSRLSKKKACRSLLEIFDMVWAQHVDLSRLRELARNLRHKGN